MIKNGKYSMSGGGKKRRLFIAFFGILVFVIFNGTGYADSGNYGVAANIGTLGIGGEITRRISSKFNARLGINGFSYSYSGNESNIEYDIDLRLLSVPIFLDWHPFEGNFRISSGLIINQNKLEGKAKLSTTETIGNNTYTSAQIGTLKATMDFNNVSPYVGLGWGNAVGKDKKWGFTSNIGVVFQGTPNVKMSATGLLASDSTFLADLDRESKDFEDALNEFKYYPVLSIGLTYKF